MISKTVQKDLSHCKYNVTLKFMPYDVLTGENLTLDRILVNDGDIDASSYSEENGEYLYAVDFETLKYFRLELIKNTFFPYEDIFDLNVASVSDHTIIDLGKIGLLNEIKEDVIVLRWR